jgi:ATP-binding cassette, subfamily F, member 3
VDFSIAQGSKVTIMGQNGAGKSTIIKLMSQLLRPDEGQVVVRSGERVACAMQTMPLACRDWTVDEFLTHQLNTASSSDDGDRVVGRGNAEPIVEPLARYEFEAKKAKALKAVVLHAPGDRIIKSFSGGQQARLLLAAALIRKPTVLLLDEPTNNLDSDGLYHLQNLITTTEQTCVVISHDEDFLNSFTDQVLYLDIFSKKIEMYQGNYYNVKTEIAKRIKRENAENARRQEKAQEKKDQANKFAKKGGNLRKVAKTMRKVASEMEDGLVDVRKEDVSLRNFVIPFTSPTASTGKMLRIAQVSGYQRSAPLSGGVVDLRKGSRVQVCGPNGIGKTTFLEMIVAGTAPGVTIEEEASVGYYRQDFHNFDFESTVLACLERASNRRHTNEQLYTTAAAFLLRGKSVMAQPVGTLSEGQKGLLSLACLTLQQPSILILDEVTNHINFRHLPALVHAIRSFEGPVLLVSHDHHFVSSVGVDLTIDMGKELQSPTKSSDVEPSTKSALAA